MASRFPHHRNDRTNNLFSAYDAQPARAASSSPAIRANNSTNNPYSSYTPNPYSAGSYPRPASAQPPGAFASAYPSGGSGSGNGNPAPFRSATPNRKGQYSDAVLSELESQNDEQLEGMSAKVRMLKDITTAIGTEIRDSTALTEKMNDQFENTRVRLKGTMNRMLRMAEKTGVSWKIWVAFFLAVIVLFTYVWLF